MKPWVKAALVTTLVAAPAFFLGPILFTPADVGVEPTAAQLPQLIIDFGGLLFIDYIFDLPLEVAAVALALSFITLMKSRTSSSEAPAAEEPPGGQRRGTCPCQVGGV